MKTGEQKSMSASDNFPQQILCLTHKRRAIARRNRTIIELCEQGFNASEISEYIRLTRQRVAQILKAANIKPRPRKITATCETCKKEFTKFRTLIVKSKRHFCSRSCFTAARRIFPTVPCHACHAPCRQSRFGKRSFCSQKCYHSVRQDGRYKPSRQGQRRAHKAVAPYFEIQPGNVIHHEDRDNKNNSLSNLRVFRNQADHMAYHHGNPDAKPIWDGRTA